jgi:hypothetical protein
MARKEEIEARLKELAEERSILRNELKAIEDATLAARVGFGPGDTIVAPDGTKFLVHSFESSWAKGYQFRKDGTPSKSLRNIFSLSACKKVTPENT